MILRKLSHYSNKRKLRRKKWLEFKSQQSKYLEFILKTKVKRKDKKKEKEMKRKDRKEKKRNEKKRKRIRKNKKK